jgi:hypothetical protein
VTFIYRETVERAVLYFFLALAAVEALSLLYWILLPLGAPSESLSWIKDVSQLESQIFYAIAPFTPVLFTLFIFSWIAKPVLWALTKKKPVAEVEAKNPSAAIPTPAFLAKLTGKQTTALILFSSMVAAALLALYPYSSALNPDHHYIGVDIPYYARDYLPKMANQTSLLQTISYAFFTLKDRPLSLLLMYAINMGTGLSTWAVATSLPTMLAPLTVPAIYYFSKQAGFNKTITFLSIIFSVFSYHFTAGMFAGLLSNWIAVIEVYLFSGLLIKSMKLNSWHNGFAAAGMAILLLFTNEETWFMLMGVVAVFAFLRILQGIRRKNILPSALKLLAIAFAAGAIVFLANYAKWYRPVMSGVNLQNLTSYWSTVYDTFYLYLFHALLNPAIVFMALVGALAILSKGERTHTYLTSWLLASSLPFTISTMTFQGRILYNLPIPIFAAYGLSAILNMIEDSREQKKYDKLKLTIAAVLILMGLNYAMRLMFEISEISFPILPPFPWG